MMTPLRGNLLNQYGTERQYINNDSENDENEMREYAVNGWELGYEVEMNGIGISEFNEESDDWSDSSDDNDVDDHQDRISSLNTVDPYVAYQAIPTSPLEAVDSDDNNEPVEWSQEQTHQTQNPTNSTDSLAEIDLDEVKISVIREAMIGFNIAPPPQWNSVPNDEQLIDLVKQMTGS